MNVKTLGFTCATLLALGAIGLASNDSNATRQDGKGDRHGRMGHRAQRIERREFVRSLHFTDGQRAQALEAARAIQPKVAAARAEARKIVSEARAANPTGDREAVRAAVRERLQALRDRTRAEIEPTARALAGTITPDQRQKLVERAERHGRTFDQDRFAGRLGKMLARPRAVEFLERRARR